MNINELNERFEDLNLELSAEIRLQKYLDGEAVDCLPYNLFGSEFIIGEGLGYTTSMISQDFVKNCEIIKIKKEQYGLEDLLVGMGLRTIGEAVGSKMNVPNHGIESVSEYFLEDWSDFNKIKNLDPYNNHILAPILETGKDLRKIFPDIAMTGTVKSPISAASAIRPLEKMLKDTRKNKEQLHELLEFCLNANLEWVKAYTKEIGSTRVMISDPVSSGNLLSKNQYLEFGLPYFIRLFNGIKEITGINPGTHICGITNHFWDELSKIDLAYFSIDDCESMIEAKEKLGKKMMIVGNVPPVNIFRLGTIDDVIKYCKDLIYNCADSEKGLMLMSGCDIPLGTPLENIKAFVWAARTYGAGAKLGEMPEGMKED